jgi:acyl carrier protein
MEQKNKTVVEKENTEPKVRYTLTQFQSIVKDIDKDFELIYPQKVEGSIPLEWVVDVVIQVSSLQLKLNPEVIKLKSRFERDLKADSLDLVEISLKLEQILGIKIPDYSVGAIITVEDASLTVHKIITQVALQAVWEEFERRSKNL